MSFSTLAVKELLVSYKNWLVANPEKISDLETSLKWISYFVVGRINNSVVLTECVYTASNLFVLLNDRLITSSTIGKASEEDKLRVWLSVLEYSEVFIEISASKLWGTRGKWIIVAAIQIIKCATRLILLLKHKRQLISSPAMTPLKRHGQGDLSVNGNPPTVDSIAFKLKRSGRVVRKVEAAPPDGFRLWRPPMANGNVGHGDIGEEEIEEQLLRRRLIAEVLYIIKPIVHLATGYKYGLSSWRPWLISLGLDISSLHLLRTNRRQELTEAERIELSRRSLLLLLYLLRSPFYERHGHDRLSSLLDALSRTIPLARFVCGPIQQYIPFWSSTYSYSWST